MDGPIRHEGVYVFEPFRLDPVSRTLSRHGERIPLPARLFDTLLCLVVNHDRLVERDELVQAVWPTRTVDAGSAARAISSLRDVLKSNGGAETMIVTAPGRGYRFGARVAFAPLEPPPAPGATDPAPLADAPDRAPATRLRPRTLLAAAVAIGVVAAVTTAIRLRPVHEPAATAPQETPFAPPPHTVAVLPFANLTADPAENYLADGLAQELIDELGSLASLHVAARRSSFSFKGRDVPIQQIGRALGVGAVLDGSIRRYGARVRVHVQLVDAVTGYQMWSQSYERDQGDILSLEGQIAGAVMASLKIVLLGDEMARLGMGGTTNGRAFDAYLNGVSALSDDDHPSDRRALAAFDEAVALDPGYALAYALRARALTLLASDGEYRDPDTTRRMFAAARQDAEKSVALAPELGTAHAALAFVLNCTLSGFRRVAEEYGRAVALAPGNAAILLSYAKLLVQLDHMPQAVAVARRAAALDPLTPATYRSLAMVLAYAGRFDEAQQALDRARRLPPADPKEDRINEGHLETWKGDAAAAARTCAGALDFRDTICLAWAYHRLGRQADAEASLAKAKASEGNNAAFIFANIYAGWGRNDEALHWLDVAYRVRDPGLMYMKVTPMLAPLHDTPLFREIEGNLDFPP